MAWLWLLVAVVAAFGALAAIRRWFGPRRTERRLALPLAVVERSCVDAVAELCKVAALDAAPEDEEELLPPSPRGRAELYVNPFDPAALALTRISDGELAALGLEAAREHRRLVAAIEEWNRAAGTKSPVERLLPALLAAHEAAQELARQIERHHLELARRVAERRILFGLVAMPPSETALVN